MLGLKSSGFTVQSFDPANSSDKFGSGSGVIQLLKL